MNDKDRVKLVKAMGIKSQIIGSIKGVDCWSFNPFTDANDDYMVLEHFRNKKKPGGGTYKSDIHSVIEWMRSVDYQIGDYARAALKVIE